MAKERTRAAVIQRLVTDFSISAEEAEKRLAEALQKPFGNSDLNFANGGDKKPDFSKTQPFPKIRQETPLQPT